MYLYDLAGTAKKSELPSQVAFNAAYSDITARQLCGGDPGFSGPLAQELMKEMDQAHRDLGLRRRGANAPSLMDWVQMTLRKKMLMEKMEKELELIEPRTREGMEELRLAFVAGINAMGKMPPRPA